MARTGTSTRCSSVLVLALSKQRAAQAANEAETAEVAEAAEATEADAEESFQRDSCTDFSLKTLVSLVSYSGRYCSCFGVERVA